MVGVMYTNVVGNVSPTDAFLTVIGFGSGKPMVFGGILHWVKSMLMVLAGNLTAE